LIWDKGARNSSINLRVVNGGDGFGNIECYSNAIGWKTVLDGAVTWGKTHTLTLTFNSFGDMNTFDYDIAVDDYKAKSLNLHHGLTDTDTSPGMFVVQDLYFKGGTGKVARYKLDNVVVNFP